MTLPDPLIDFAIKLVINAADHYGPIMAKKLHDQVQRVKTQKPYFAIKGNLVNRVSALRAIRDALKARNGTRIIYLYGPGGAGKTRLLEEARNIVNSNSSLRWTGIFDFYHTDLHNILRLHSAIIEDLDPGGQYFSKYREAKDLFESRRREGISSASAEAGVQSEIARINQLFIEEFNQYTSKHRTVLAFDTLEDIGEEQDLIQRTFGLGEGKESPSVRQWLLDLCRSAENAVILLAGRPHGDLKHDLEKINSSQTGRLESILLDGLTQSDTADLLKVYTRKAPRPIAELLTQNAVMIWQATRGMPVHVALLVELVLQNPGAFENKIQTKNPEAGREIVRGFFDSEDPDRRHFFFLALARKGLTANLLHSLEQGWSEDECSKRLDDADRSTLTKKRHGGNALFLHDALYEMFDNFAPYGANEKIYWFQRLKEYYLQSLDKENWVNLLYYDLRCDFLRAFYQTYVRYSEIAIKGYEMELDAQLRDEVLIYLRNDCQHMARKDADWEAVFLQDGAVRWIKRLISQTDYEQASKLAETFLILAGLTESQSSPSLDISGDNRAKIKAFMTSAPPIVRASLFTYYGEALTYLPEKAEKDVEIILRKAVGLLENLSLRQGDPVSWFKIRLLGRAYDRLGYLARTNGHYQKAAEYYRRALPFYKEVEIADEFAFTQNNLAFVLALLGDASGAKIAVEEALSKRLELGQRYPIALSYNTRGLIRALEKPGSLDGQRDCELALSIFQEINAPRGVGLACNALGFILRKRGEGWASKQCTPEQAKEWYAEAEKYFEQAREIFKDGEKIRLWEALNELGCLYREWACLLKSLQDENGAQKRFEQALDFQEQALKLTRESNMRLQQVDTLDDIAELYLDSGDFEQARKNLEECRALIPPEFNLVDAQKEPHPGEVYWFSLAKVQIREGMMKIQLARQSVSHDMLQVADAIQCLLSSFLYVRLYSDHPNYLAPKAQEIAVTLKALDIPGELISKVFQQIIGEYDFDLSVLRSALSKEYPYEDFS